MTENEESMVQLVRLRKGARKPSGSNSPLGNLFDENFYRTRYGDSIEADVDLLENYLETGWKLGRDPSPNFSTVYYLERNPDVVEAGMNPLVHYVLYGRDEGRRPAPYTSLQKTSQYRPLVSVIVPQYNHAAFLPQRLTSIIEQEYDNLEIILLDDASTDGSVEIAERILQSSKVSYRILRNTKNSGAIFEQWQRGIHLANGEVVWICESDDYCEKSFLRE
jgi:hypothetical protein